MNQPDYITRTIQQFAETLAALLFGVRSKGQDITFNDLNELSLTFTGLSLDTLAPLSTQQILSLYSVTGELDIDKVYVSARLLYQLAEQESDKEKTLFLKNKVLDLLLEVYEKLGEYLNEDHKSFTQNLKDDLER